MDYNQTSIWKISSVLVCKIALTEASFSTALKSKFHLVVFLCVCCVKFCNLKYIQGYPFCFSRMKTSSWIPSSGKRVARKSPSFARTVTQGNARVMECLRSHQEELGNDCHGQGLQQGERDGCQTWHWLCSHAFLQENHQGTSLVFIVLVP